MENQEKNESITEWYGCGKHRMVALPRMEAIECFKLLGMRSDGTNAIAQRV